MINRRLDAELRCDDAASPRLKPHSRTLCHLDRGLHRLDRHCHDLSASAKSAPVHSAAPAAADTIASAAAVPAASASSLHPSSADDKCIHLPRHERDDHDAAADAALAAAPSTSGGSSNSSGPSNDSNRSDPSPASRLHRHALESILFFSDLNTLSAVVRVSKEWLGAVGSMGALALQADCSTASVEFVAASAMGRHVSDLEIDVNERMNADEAGSLALCMPHLRRLRCMFPPLPVDGPLLFPAGLRQLELFASDPHRIDVAAAAAGINAAIAAAGRLTQLEILVLWLYRSVEPLISLAPLSALPHLRRLIWSRTDPYTDLTGAQVAELRALPHLQCLFAPTTTTSLERLLAQPHSLQWQDLSLPSPLTDDAVALLPQLPTLTSFSLSAECLTNFDFLHGLPNLASLLCSFGYDNRNAVLPGLLVAGLGRCTNVTNLHLDRCGVLSAAHLANLLPRLSRLQSLTLDDLDIDSLSFLAQAPMTSQLRSLTLANCLQLPVSELRHVHSLRGLHQLCIDDSFDEQMDPSHGALMALRPPSAAAAVLQLFPGGLRGRPSGGGGGRRPRTRAGSP